MIPFAQVSRSGLEAEALGGEPGAAAPEAGDHLVGDEEHAALAADPLHLLEVALGRREHAARADHGLAEERGDAILAHAVDRLLERRRTSPSSTWTDSSSGPKP